MFNAFGKNYNNTIKWWYRLKEIKTTKNVKETKDSKNINNVKDTKEAKTTKNAKEEKDLKNIYTVKSTREIFSENLKYFRLSREWSQEKLAERVNVTSKHISDLERQKSTPSFELMDALGKVFFIETYELFKECKFHKLETNRVDVVKGYRERRKK